MSMTKKDYESIAGVIADYRHRAATSVNPARAAAAAEVAEGLAKMMGAQNPSFQRDTFLDACRPSQRLKVVKR